MELWVEQNVGGRGNNTLALEGKKGNLETFRKMLEILELFPVIYAMVPQRGIIAKADWEEKKIRFEWSFPTPGGWTPGMTMTFELALSRSRRELQKLIGEKIGIPV